MRARRVLLSVLLLAATAAAGRAQDGDAPPPEHDMTRKHAGDAPQHTNRLAAESSPYLLQHAHNPVDWYPWGDEAFAKAREEDKPVFLSIGYSTCHWCHVMERESFENEDIAAVLNEHFVCIKVDREERPDVDAIYMSAVQAMSGRGGWPLSVWLTHDRKPFLGGTYFPPDDRYGRPGFRTVLARIAELWETRRDELLQQAETLVDHVRSQSGAKGGGELTLDTLETCVRQHAGAFDAQHGGFGPAPKFPHAFSVSLLLRQAGRGGADQILPMLRGTLDAMLDGGIHDHLGGGFHRYSTDREWLLPHFEKMLYDQASLARAYVEAYQVTGEERYAEVAHGIFGYVLRDLRDPGGGFHSAEDADSEGEEGKFYVWTPAEIAAVLGDEDAALVCDVYEVRAEGNFRDEATHEPSGTSILHLRETLRTHAQRRGVDLPAFRERLAELRDRLLAARARRVRPHLDDKVLTDWNGLMIGALALGGTALREPRYVEAAREAAEFLVATMRTDGGLLHRYRDGRAGIDGFLTDHAFLADGLVELHQATQDPRWLAVARDLVKEMVSRFRRADGTFVLAAGRGDELVAETVELYDGDRPSGNSAAVLALLRVGRLTGDEELARLGRESLAAWSGTIERYPMGYTYALRALDLELGPTREIVIAGDPASPATQALLAAARDRFVARDVVLVHPPGDAGAAVRELSPFVARQLPVDGLPAAYVCTNHTCAAPVTDPDALRAALRGAD